MSIFVSHPGLQHSYQLAWALHEHGLLKQYWSGVPVISSGDAAPFWLSKSNVLRMKTTGVPPQLRRNPIIFQILLRFGKFLPINSGIDYSHRVFHLFDWWVAQHICKLNPKVVVAYENSAFHTFRAAKLIGARCILDAPAVHYATAARLTRVRQTPYLTEINRRKNEEILAADLIITCSPYAAESYVDAGVPRTKIKSVLLGATLPHGLKSWKPHTRPLHFLFAGAPSQLKAIDTILSTFQKLQERGIPFNLSFVGGNGTGEWVREIERHDWASYRASVPQSELYQLLSEADCLLLPSRFDSFGMVVAEAMACGTPAIVSSQTGAKAMIDKFPGSGWVIESTVEDLYRCVSARIANRQELFNARLIAKEASREFTWSAYRARVGDLISSWL